MAAFLNGIFQLLCVLCICALLEAGIFVPCIPLPRGHLAVSRDIILLLQLGVGRRRRQALEYMWGLLEK